MSELPGGDLYVLSGSDWYGSVSFSLTEPFSCTVDLHSDDASLPSVRGFVGTGDPNESVQMAVEHLRPAILAAVEKRKLAASDGAA